MPAGEKRAFAAEIAFVYAAAYAKFFRPKAPVCRKKPVNLQNINRLRRSALAQGAAAMTEAKLFHVEQFAAQAGRGFREQKARRVQAGFVSEEEKEISD